MSEVTPVLNAAYTFPVEEDDYVGLEITRLDIDVDEALVDQRFAQLLEQVSSEQITGQPIQAGDVVTIDYQGTIASDPVKGEGERIEVGLGRFLEPVEEALVGHEAGDEFVLIFTMPPVHLVQEWRKASASLHFRVVSVERVRDYEATDEYVAAVSDFDTVDELKAAVRQQYQEEAHQETLRLMQVQLAGKLSDLTRRHLSEQQCLDYAHSALAVAHPENEALSEEQRQELVNEAAFEIAWRNIALREGFSVSEIDVKNACDRLKGFDVTQNWPAEAIEAEARDGLLCNITMNFVLQAAHIVGAEKSSGDN